MNINMQTDHPIPPAPPLSPPAVPDIAIPLLNNSCFPIIPDQISPIAPGDIDEIIIPLPDNIITASSPRSSDINSYYYYKPIAILFLMNMKYMYEQIALPVVYII